MRRRQCRRSSVWPTFVGSDLGHLSFQPRFRRAADAGSSRQPSDAPTGLPAPLPTLRPSPNPTSKHPTLLPTIGPHVRESVCVHHSHGANMFYTTFSFTVTHEGLRACSRGIFGVPDRHQASVLRERDASAEDTSTEPPGGVGTGDKLHPENHSRRVRHGLAGRQRCLAKSIMRDIGADLADAVMNGTHTLFATAFIGACAEKYYTTDVAAWPSLRSLTTSVFYYDPVPSDPDARAVLNKDEDPRRWRRQQGRRSTCSLQVVGGVGAIILLCAFVKQRGRPNTQATNCEEDQDFGKEGAIGPRCRRRVITFKHRSSSWSDRLRSRTNTASSRSTWMASSQNSATVGTIGQKLNADSLGGKVPGEFQEGGPDTQSC